MLFLVVLLSIFSLIFETSKSTKRQKKLQPRPRNTYSTPSLTHYARSAFRMEEHHRNSNLSIYLGSQGCRFDTVIRLTTISYGCDGNNLECTHRKGYYRYPFPACVF
jgi:hypothetical protein